MHLAGSYLAREGSLHGDLRGVTAWSGHRSLALYVPSCLTGCQEDLQILSFHPLITVASDRLHKRLTHLPQNPGSLFCEPNMLDTTHLSYICISEQLPAFPSSSDEKAN
ncbi:hypothetical protein E2C01_084348 [Portunus trituberculatus]|uniref:Uncharacterized protein n=1 Tax=Portunus trituberculatus TaxID=210409 RepID=A0A5B7J4K0_PORTR|nr:hypothetical protein [Portunus trituberculatus]